MRLEPAGAPDTSRHRSRAKMHSGFRAQPQPSLTSSDRLAWREHVEAELASLRGTLARLETTMAEDRGSLRAARGQWTAVQAATAQLPEQIGRLRAQVERLDERMRDDRIQVRDELDGLQDDIGRLGGYTLQTQVQERMINRVEEDQARMADTITAISQGLVGERARTNTVIMAGVAVALISMTAVLLANAPRFW